jgi:Derlin-2/3
MLTEAVWYYFNDIYPPTHSGHRPLDPPSWWMRIWEGRPTETEAPETEPEELVPDAVDGREHMD